MEPANKKVSAKSIKTPLIWIILLMELVLPFLLYVGLQNQVIWLAALSGGLLLLGLIFLIMIR